MPEQGNTGLENKNIPPFEWHVFFAKCGKTCHQKGGYFYGENGNENSWYFTGDSSFL